jgi:4-amino-4-deoxy-L-arabinose transferase-like glycosyltransferase
MNRIPLRVRNPWNWLAFGLLAVLLRGLWLDVMDVDASQYASIAMEMLQNGSWLEVKHRHGEYLDKPPLLFWSSAAAFGLFGLSSWAYKLPSLLAALLGVYAVYRFTRLFYAEQTARHAAFILAASIGFVVIANDVRTDTLLLAMSACAVWQLAEYHQRPRWSALLGAFGFIGLGMLAKGPIGLVMPAFAAGTHLLLRRDWRGILRWQWLPGLAFTALLLLPMCWGLYQQFDLHPEKTVNDRNGVSGLYFYFWEQSFGRITGENIWKNDTSGFYFLHVYLWAFLPWSPLLLGALWHALRQTLPGILRPERLKDIPESYALGGFLLTFVALSQSKYKLPHYIFITLPWAAVLLAAWLNAPDKNGRPRSSVPMGWAGVACFSAAVALLASGLMLGYVFPGAALWAWALWGMGLLLWARMLWSATLRMSAGHLVQMGVLASLVAAFVLNFHFYPQLLPYQSSSAIGKHLREQGIPPEQLAFFRRHGHALDFYAQGISRRMDDPAAVSAFAEEAGVCWLYTNKIGKAELDSVGLAYETALAMGHFQVALLKPAFLNPATRAGTLEPVYLLKITRQSSRTSRSPQ